MTEQSLINRKTDSAKQYLADHLVEPFSKLRSDLDHILDEFPARWPAFSGATRLTSSMPVPAVEMTESEDEYKISVEVPGIEPGDIDLSVQQDMLMLKGEKRNEQSESDTTHTFRTHLWLFRTAYHLASGCGGRCDRSQQPKRHADNQHPPRQRQ